MPGEASGRSGVAARRGWRQVALATFAAALASAAPVLAGVVVPISEAEGGASGDTPILGAYASHLSPDGRYVLFQGESPDYHPSAPDGNGANDLVLWDGQTDTATLISIDAGGAAAGDGPSWFQEATPDGRWVIFASAASDLVAGISDTNATDDAFLWDRDSGTTWLISESATGGATGDQYSYPYFISLDGRYVLVQSRASDLVSGVTDTNNQDDLFLWDRDTGTTALISESSAGGATGNNYSYAHSMSSDGRYVLFRSRASDLLSGVTDTNGQDDLFLWDRNTGTKALISESGSGSATGNNYSYAHSMSSDGRYVLFYSRASDLVAGVTDTNGTEDLFLWDRDTGTKALISESAAGGATADSNTYPHSMTSDGRWVLFWSRATNLVSGVTDANNWEDLFLWDRDTGTKLLISESGTGGTTGNDYSYAHSMTADGRYVLFQSRASDLVAGVTDTNGTEDLFFWDRDTGTTQLISESGSGGATGNQHSSAHSMTSDGRWVLFWSSASDLVSGVTDTNGTQDLFLWDRDTGTKVLISESSSGGATGNNYSQPHSTTPDGRYVLFTSYASDLVPGATDTNGTQDLFVWDRDTGTKVLISESSSGGATGDSSSSAHTMTSDGRYVLFQSRASDLVSGVADTNDRDDLFLWDRLDGSTKLVDRRRSSASMMGLSDSQFRAASEDGRYVLFMSYASNLVAGVIDGNGTWDVYQWDRVTQSTSLVSEAASGGATGNQYSEPHSMSSDGRYVLFRSYASDLVTGVTDSNSQEDLFLWDRDTGTTLLISESGSGGATGNNASYPHSMTSDGRYVLFNSYATDLISGVTDTNGTQDLFLWDRDTGTTELISESGSGGATGNSQSSPHSMTSDGRYLLFQSSATDLVSGVTDTNSQQDLFLWDRDTGTTVLISASSSGSATGNHVSSAHSMTSDGRYVLFQSRATDLVSGVTDTNETWDVFLWDRDTGTKVLISESGSGGATGNHVSSARSMTSDGRYVLFYSRASDLVSGVTDSNGQEDLFLWDRDTGTKALISESSSGGATGNNYSYPHSMSSDGRYVLFYSHATDLVSGVTDSNGTRDLFLWDRDAGTKVLVSEAGSGGATGNQYSEAHSMTSDGRYVLFYSHATDLVSGVTDSNGTQDLFLWDRDAGTTLLISESSSGGATASGGSSAHSMTPDGESVLFTSWASDLVAGQIDPNGSDDVFRWNRTSGQVELLSHVPSDAARTGNLYSYPVFIDPTGEGVVFWSYASDLTTGYAQPWVQNLYLHTEGSATAAPVAEAGGPYGPVDEGSSFALNGSGSSDANGDLVAWDWDLDGDAEFDDASGEMPLVSFADDGTIAIALRVTDATALTDEDAALVEVVNVAPSVDAGPDEAVDEDSLYPLAASYADPGTADTHTATIDWGDGSPVEVVAASGGAVEATHLFADPGLYTVTVTVTDDDGDAGNDELEISVADVTPPRVALVDSLAPSGDGELAEGDATNALVTGLTVAFDEPVEALDANDPSRYRLLADGGDGGFETPDCTAPLEPTDGEVGLLSATYDGPSATTTLALAVGEPLGEGLYRLLVCGPLPDLSGNGFDGDDDGAAGGEFGRLFEIDFTAPAVAEVLGNGDVPIWDGLATNAWIGALEVRFDDAMHDLLGDEAVGDVTNPASYRLVYDGQGAFDTGDCDDEDPGDDLPVGFDGIAWDAGQWSATLAIEGGATLWDGHYRLFACDTLLDHAGNPLAGGDFRVDFLVDTMPPAAPPLLLSTSHTPYLWSPFPFLTMLWSGASDGWATSGVAGYALALDALPFGDPDGSWWVGQGGDPHLASNLFLPDGEWYFHLEACDHAGNCAAPLDAGPYLVDTVGPAPPASVDSPSHDGGLGAAPEIEVVWSPALDNASGVAGYAWHFSASSSWSCDEVEDGDESVQSATSPVLGEGVWYFHLCARDNAGNWGGAGSYGPWTIDLIGPAVTGVDSVAAADWTVPGPAVVESALTQLLVAFDEEMATSGAGSVLESANWLLVEAGGDLALATADCSGAAGDDLPQPLAGVQYDAGLGMAALAVGPGSGLSAGSYRLLACPTLTDVAGNGLDGADDGGGPEAFARDFVVTQSRHVLNPNFDGGLDGWIASGPVPEEWSLGAEDAEGRPFSGAAQLETTAGMGGTWYLEQCVETIAPGAQGVSALVRTASGEPGAPSVRAFLTWADAPGCGGNWVELGESVPLAGSSSGVWLPLAVPAVEPPPGAVGFWLTFEVAGGTAQSFTVEIDRSLYPDSWSIFDDGFESGDSCAWSETVGGPACAP